LRMSLNQKNKVFLLFINSHLDEFLVNLPESICD
jgi:hypothetical protein